MSRRKTTDDGTEEGALPEAETPEENNDTAAIATPPVDEDSGLAFPAEDTQTEAAPMAAVEDEDTAATSLPVVAEQGPAAVGESPDEDGAVPVLETASSGDTEPIALTAEQATGVEAAVPEGAAPEDNVSYLESVSAEEALGESVDATRLESIVETLLFASDRPLGMAELKRLLGERDGKRVTTALESLQARRAGTGIHVTAAAGGWQLRTNPENAPWAAKLLSGKPVRLSRAMLETLAIVAYRQPVTRPEIDEIRGVDCGPVLKTLLDRTLIRIIGKKEEVGRPLLYGTTPEFLRTFNLRDLTELPTLRQFHELGTDERAEVDAHEKAAEAAAPEGGQAFTPHPPLPPDPAENDGLLDELDQAAQAAARATADAAASEKPAPEPEQP
jgi:segregation and condensation protein B